MTKDWYGVRSLYRTATHTEIEERITVWRATTERQALLMALGEAHGHVDDSFLTLVGVLDAQLFTVPEVPGEPWIVFRNEIPSTMSRRKFVRKFAQTGKELQSLLFQSDTWDSEAGLPEVDEDGAEGNDPRVFGVRLYVRRRDRAGYTEVNAAIVANGRHEAVNRVRKNVLERVNGGTLLPVVQTYFQDGQMGLTEGTECFSIVRETKQSPDKYARKRYPNGFFSPKRVDEGSDDETSWWFDVETTFRNREDGSTFKRTVSWLASSADDAIKMALGEAIAFAAPDHEVVGMPDVELIPGGADVERIQGGTTYFEF